MGKLVSGLLWIQGETRLGDNTLEFQINCTLNLTWKQLLVCNKSCTIILKSQSFANMSTWMTTLGPQPFQNQPWIYLACCVTCHRDSFFFCCKSHTPRAQNMTRRTPRANKSTRKPPAKHTKQEQTHAPRLRTNRNPPQQATEDRISILPLRKPSQKVKLLCFFLPCYDDFIYDIDYNYYTYYDDY